MRSEHFFWEFEYPDDLKWAICFLFVYRKRGMSLYDIPLFPDRFLVCIKL